MLQRVKYAYSKGRYVYSYVDGTVTRVSIHKELDGHPLVCPSNQLKGET